MSDQASTTTTAPTPDDNAGLREQLAAARQSRQQGQEPSEQSTGQEPAQQESQEQPNPPWGNEEFDPQRAWTLLQNVRGDLQRSQGRNRELEAEKSARERQQMSELDRTKAERDDLQRQLGQTRLEALKSQVAIAKGLSAEAMEFLSGSTQEELEANADKLKRMIGASESASPRSPDYGAGARPNGGQAGEEDFSSMIRKSAGRPA